MKFRNICVLRGARPLRFSATVVALVLLSAPLPGAAGSAAGTAAGAGEPAKPYTLFMGANLSAEWQGRLWPVQGVQRNAFVIDAGGRPVLIRDTDLRMKIDSALKMTMEPATVADLKAEPAYTPANDPRGKARGAMLMAGVAADARDLAIIRLNSLQNSYGIERSYSVPADQGPSTHSVSDADLANASDAFQQTLAAQGSEMSSVGDAISRERSELSRKLFDAFSLSFRISAERPLENPYLVAVVHFHEKPDDPRTARVMVYAQVLPSIGRKPQTVRLLRGGFPRGYQLDSCQIHIYERGTEVGTSVAPNRVAMTRDEAFQYSRLDYLIRNRDRTLPPAPAATFWPRDLSTRLPAKKLNRPLYVRVGKDGRASGFYGDLACTRPVNAADLDALRSNLYFDPALDKGQPVEGVVAVDLGRDYD